MDLTLIAAGIAIGLSVTAPLGPVNIIVIRTALRRSMWVAVLAGMGAVLADVMFAGIAAYGVRSIERLVIDYAKPLMFVGGILLVAIGIRIARSHISLADLNTQEPPTRRQVVSKILTTFMLTLTNPGAFFGFLAIFGTMSGILHLGSAPYRPMVAVLGVAIGGTLWWLFLSFLVSKLKARISTRILDRVNRWTGVVIAGFGFALIMDAVF
jgi:threonine/homoserine/homoserine lactone efflux protein